MKLVEGDKIALKESGQQTEINPVGKLGVQIINLQVQLVEVLVHKRHQRLLHHLWKQYNIKYHTKSNF